jgi:hypothetical protein
MSCVRPLKSYLNLLRFLMTLALLLAPVTAVAGKPMVKAKIESMGKIWVGQKTVVVVKLYSPTYFSGVPKFDLPEVSGLVLMKVPGRPVIGSEQVGDDTYSVQRHELFIYPQRAGKVTIPSFPVQFGVAGVGMATPSRHVLNTRQLHFTARMPAGAEHLQTLISAHKLDVSERWRTVPEEPMVGDAFTRSISFRAHDIPGMAFPPIPPMTVPGLAIYPGPAQVHDKVSRGDLTGERVESITYVCETPGEVRIPALVFHWWDLSAKRLRRIEFPEVQLKIAPDPEQAKPTLITPTSNQGPRGFTGLLITSGVALLVLLVLFFFRRRLTMALRQRLQRRAASEVYAFAQLLSTCRQDDPAVVLKVFWLWMDRLPPASRVVTLDDLVRSFPQPQLAVELQCLQQAILGLCSGWNGVALARCLKKVRKTMLLERQRTLRRPLPDLNPRHP